MGRRRNSSEQEDDPEPFQDSGSDFDVEEAKREESGRRKSSRASKKSRKSFKEESGTDEEEVPEPEESDSEEEAPKRKRKTPAKKGGKANAAKASPKAKKKPAKKDKDDEEDEEDEEEENGENEEENSEGENEGNGKEAASNDSDSSQGRTTSTVQSRGIHRKFIPKTIYSEDYATGSFVILKKDAHTGAEKHPCIWRIDGKALLQKYEAFDEEEKVRHKNTSIYTGWSPLDKDLYAPITVDVVRHNNNNLTVEVHWDKLKEIQVDSE